MSEQSSSFDNSLENAQGTGELHAYWLQVRRGHEWRNIEPNSQNSANQTQESAGLEVFEIMRSLLAQGNFDELRLTRGTREANGEIHYELLASFAPNQVLSLDPKIQQILGNALPSYPNYNDNSQVANQSTMNFSSQEDHNDFTQNTTNDKPISSAEFEEDFGLLPLESKAEGNLIAANDWALNQDNDFDELEDLDHEQPKAKKSGGFKKLGLLFGFILVVIIGTSWLLFQMKDSLPFMGEIESLFNLAPTPNKEGGQVIVPKLDKKLDEDIQKLLLDSQATPLDPTSPEAIDAMQPNPLGSDSGNEASDLEMDILPEVPVANLPENSAPKIMEAKPLETAKPAEAIAAAPAKAKPETVIPKPIETPSEPLIPSTVNQDIDIQVQPEVNKEVALIPKTTTQTLSLNNYRQIMKGFTWNDRLFEVQVRMDNCKDHDSQFKVCKLLETNWFPDSSAVVAQFDKFDEDRLVALQIYGKPVKGEAAAKEQFESIVNEIKGRIPDQQQGFNTRRVTAGTDFFSSLRNDGEKNVYFSYWSDNEREFPLFIYAKLSPLANDEGFYHILIGKPKAIQQ